MSLKYTCPGCGTPLGYEGLCWKCKSEQERKAALAWTLVLCTAAGSAKIDAQAAGSQAAVSIGNDMVSIGNDYISREYSIADGHIKTAQIVNKRIGTNLVPQDGSQDFVINTLGEADTAEPGTPSEDTDKITNEPQWELSTPDAISKEGWSAKLTNSAGTEFPENAVNTLFDNELGSYPNEYTISGHPFTLDIDLGETRTIASMSVTIVSGGSGKPYLSFTYTAPSRMLMGKSTSPSPSSGSIPRFRKYCSPT